MNIIWTSRSVVGSLRGLPRLGCSALTGGPLGVLVPFLESERLDSVSPALAPVRPWAKKMAHRLGSQCFAYPHSEPGLLGGVN